MFIASSLRLLATSVSLLGLPLLADASVVLTPLSMRESVTLPAEVSHLFEANTAPQGLLLQGVPAGKLLRSCLPQC